MLNGSIYDTTEAMTGMMFLILIILSTLSVANARLSNATVPMEFEDFRFSNAIKTWGGKLMNVIEKHLLPNKNNKGGILVWWAILLVILMIPCIVIGAKKDKPSNRKEQKKRGYRNNLISIVMGIGSVYGLFAIMYAYSVIPFNE